MKKVPTISQCITAFATLCMFLLLCFGFCSAQEIDSCSLEEYILNPRLYQNAESEEEVFELMAAKLESSDCKDYIDCEKIWERQQFFENFLIPLIQLIIGTNNDICTWFAFGVIIDATFWIPLSCCCNFDNSQLQHHCFIWLYDIAFNGYMLFNECL